MKENKQIRVIWVNAFGPAFSNLIPGSIHDVIEACNGKDSKRGVWVMGMGEPVLLLNGEFEWL